jgi:hypothetical protein
MANASLAKRDDESLWPGHFMRVRALNPAGPSGASLRCLLSGSFSGWLMVNEGSGSDRRFCSRLTILLRKHKWILISSS